MRELVSAFLRVSELRFASFDAEPCPGHGCVVAFKLVSMLASEPDVEPMPVLPLSDGDPERDPREFSSELDCPLGWSAALLIPLRPSAITVANAALKIVLTIR
jgi:hypothetical protein